MHPTAPGVTKMTTTFIRQQLVGNEVLAGLRASAHGSDVRVIKPRLIGSVSQLFLLIIAADLI